MPPFINLEGQRFGRWEVIQHKGQTSKGTSLWLCRCSCGNTKIVLYSSLRSGQSQSCGCLKKQINTQKFFKDLTGKKFGKLTVLGYVRADEKSRMSFWDTVCECGNTKIVRGSRLISGETKSCGCIRGKHANKNFIDLTGNRYGRLLVLYRDKNKLGKTKGHWSVMWTCQCDCGNQKSIATSSLNDGSTKSCGCLSGESFIAIEVKNYFMAVYNSLIEYSPLLNPQTGYGLRYDIFCPKHNVFIEINGKQHYEFTRHFHKSPKDFLDSQRRDKYKKDFAKRNGTYIEVDLRKIKTVEEAIAYIEQRL